MNKPKFARTRKFVVEHQTGLLITATVVSTAAAVLMRGGIKQHDDFLKEHDLYEEFYAQID